MMFFIRKGGKSFPPLWLTSIKIDLNLTSVFPEVRVFYMNQYNLLPFFEFFLGGGYVLYNPPQYILLHSYSDYSEFLTTLFLFVFKVEGKEN